MSGSGSVSVTLPSGQTFQTEPENSYSVPVGTTITLTSGITLPTDEPGRFALPEGVHIEVTTPENIPMSELEGSEVVDDQMVTDPPDEEPTESAEPAVSAPTGSPWAKHPRACWSLRAWARQARPPPQTKRPPTRPTTPTALRRTVPMTPAIRAVPVTRRATREPATRPMPLTRAAPATPATPPPPTAPATPADPATWAVGGQRRRLGRDRWNRWDQWDREQRRRHQRGK
jgi:hypothetical protein